MSLDLPPSLDVLNLKKPSKSGIPKERLSDPSKASALVQALIYANRERAQVDAHVKGMLDGNAPFSYAELRSKGQGQRTNVNFREGEAMLGDAMTPFYDLFAESDSYAKIEVDEQDTNKRTEWSRIVTEEFDALMKEWAGFDWNMQAILFDMVGYGKGFAMWPDKTCWQFKGVRQSRVLVPDQTPSDIDQLELLVVRQSCTVSELYNSIRDTDRAKSIGWDTGATLEACGRAMPESTANQTMDWELVQQELRNHDLYQMTRSSVVKIAHVFVKEFNNKVTHLIIEELDGRSDSNKPSGVFLYKKIGRFDSFRQVVSPLFYDIGDGTWHSIKGLMIKLYPFIEIKNRLNCSVVDNAFINMSVLVRPTTSQAATNAAIMHLGPLSVLPPNVEIQQWGLTGRMEEGLAVESALTRKLESNLGQYRKPLLKEQGNPATATQVTYDAAKEAALGKGAVNRFYVQLDSLFEQTFKRAANPNLTEDYGQNCAAMEFQRRCEDRGVPKVKLQKPRFIRASRNIGNGSIFLRQQTVMQTAQFVPMMNEAGRQAWLDDAISVMAGTEAVSRWNPKQGLSNELQNQQSLAMIENGVMNAGAPVKWTNTQNNAVHLATHLKAAGDAVNSLNPQNNGGGGDPGQVIGFLNTAGPHIALHLQQLKADPTQKKVFDFFSQQFEELAKVTEALKQRMQQAMMQQKQQAVKMQQRQQQTMNDAQLAQFETMHKAKLADAKAQSDMQRKDRKTEQQLSISDATAASGIAIRQQEAQADAQIKRIKATETA